MKNNLLKKTKTPSRAPRRPSRTQLSAPALPRAALQNASCPATSAITDLDEQHALTLYRQINPRLRPVVLYVLKYMCEKSRREKKLKTIIAELRAAKRFSQPPLPDHDYLTQDV